MCERTEKQGLRGKCAEFSGEPAYGAGVAVLSEPPHCSLAPQNWLPGAHGFRTLRLSGSENQGVARSVRDAGPDPSRNYEQFLQIRDGEESNSCAECVTVTITEDVALLTEQTINDLLGKDVSARFRFIMERAGEVKELDV